MRITLTVSAIILVALLTSCSSRTTTDEGSNNSNQNQTGGSTLGGGATGTTDNTVDNDSFAGLWDKSDGIITVYQLWNDEGSFVIYDDQRNEGGTGENCFELTEVPYTREGNDVTYDGVTYVAIRNGNELTIGADVLTLITYLSVDDIPVCS